MGIQSSWILIQGESGPGLNALIAALVVFVTFLIVLAAGIGVSYMAAVFFLRLVHPPEKPQARLTAATVGSGD